MKITDIFVKRPVLAICMNLIILLAGIQAVRNLTTRQYPKSDLAVVSVKTAYIGANADLVRGFITTPLERAIASADGIDYLDSSSKQGLSTINAHLRLNYDTNSALTQIQAKVAQVRNELPGEAEAPVIDVETSDNRFASMYLSFYSKELEANQITDYLTRVVQPKLSSIAGVQKADILGARTFAMRIWLKSEKMAARGLSPSDVSNALAANNYLAAIGNTKGSMVTVNLTANTDLHTKEEFEDLIVKREGNSLVKLGEIADVVLGAENYDEDVRFGGQSATFMGIWVLPNANSLDVIKDVRKVLPEIEASLPSGLSLGVPYDATKYIEDSIQEVLKTLAETIFIVILVIYLFIGSLRAVLVPVVAIPLSLIGGIALMYIMGFTLNLLTLLAIVLAVGLVVDDAIVMLENIERHARLGKRPLEAAIIAARELVGPIISMTITLAAVYAPIGIQGGLTGALFKEFAFTLAGAVMVSGFVALTLSPMMSSKLVKANDEGSNFKMKVEAFFSKLNARYKKLLVQLLNKHRYTVITAALIFALCTFPLYMFSLKELAPREDQGVIFGIVQASPNSSLDQTTLYTEKVSQIFESFPEYKTSFQLTGPTFGFSGMVTKPWTERSRTTQELEPEAWTKAAKIPGVRVIMTTPPPLPGGSDFPIEFVISSTEDPTKLYNYANQLVGAAFASGKFMFADSDLKYDLPETEISIDREKAASLGFDLKSIGNDLANFTGGNYVNRFNIQGRSYKVIPQAKRRERLNPEQLEDVYLKNSEGKIVTLSSLAKLVNQTKPRELKRFQQLNSATIQGAVPPGVSIDEALAVLENAASGILPAGYSIDYAGESRQLRKEGSTLLTTLFFAIILIYLVLAAQFESFRDPFIILMGSVPLALSAALIFPFLGATSMNIYSQVGLVTLVGLVSKNGILIVEFANTLQEEGLNKFDAVIEAASTRLRPILMTSVATVAGHFPLILASGAGAGARNSIGIVLVSGMLVGTVFTLFVVPVIYLFIASKKSKTEHESSNQNGFASKIISLSFVLSLLLFSSCAVGPNYKRPKMTLPKKYAEGERLATKASSVKWWESFKDKTLNKLIRQAVKNNKGIKQTLSRVNQSRALARQSKSELLPGAQVAAGYEKSKNPGSRFPGEEKQGFSYEVYTTSLDASWEIDIFGGLRRDLEAKNALYSAQVAELEDALRLLTAEVGITYFQLRGAQLQLKVAKKNAAIQNETLGLVRAKYDSGIVGELDLLRTRTQLEQTRADIPPLEAAVKTNIHRLSVLIGKEPKKLETLLIKRKDVPTFNGAITLDHPAKLLRRRPDLRVAERNLAAETANIGVAIAALYPKITFQGSLGLESPNFSNLNSSNSETYIFGPKIIWRPLDTGKLRAQVRFTEAKTEEALYAYEEAVLRALEDVENALANFSAERQRRNKLKNALNTSRKAHKLAKDQYQQGALDLLSVLDIQKSVLENENNLALSQQGLASSVVGIYKALGGGWEDWELVEKK